MTVNSDAGRRSATVNLHDTDSNRQMSGSGDSGLLARVGIDILEGITTVNCTVMAAADNNAGGYSAASSELRCRRPL